MLLKGLGLAVALGSAAISPAALADDWVAVSVSGIVMAIKDGHWTHLHPNDAISDQQQIRTLASGKATFERRGETVTIAGDTGISISEERGGRYTRVTQWFGQAAVADNEQARPHFEVDTPYMAAVVKGTVFTVWTKQNVSGVDVTRGRVAVFDPNSHLHVDVLPGQHASAGATQPLTLGGSGSLQPMLNNAGKVVATAVGTSSESAGSTTSTGTAVTGSANSAGDNGAGTGNGNTASGQDSGMGNGGTPGNGGQNGNTAGNGSTGSSDNGVGNGGTPGNGGRNGNAGGNGNSGKSDNGKGNGGAPGNGGQNGNGHGHKR